VSRAEDLREAVRGALRRRHAGREVSVAVLTLRDARGWQALATVRDPTVPGAWSDRPLLFRAETGVPAADEAGALDALARHLGASVVPSPTRLQRALGALPLRLQWLPHNLVAHPLSELLYQFGFPALAHGVHDATAPDRSPEPRG